MGAGHEGCGRMPDDVNVRRQSFTEPTAGFLHACASVCAALCYLVREKDWKSEND